MKAVTTISINPEVLTHAQNKAHQQSTNLSRIIEELLRTWANIPISTYKKTQDEIDAYKTQINILNQKLQKEIKEEQQRFTYIQEESPEETPW